MDNCDNCGGYINNDDLPASFIRHNDECLCIHCPHCNEIIGNSIDLGIGFSIDNIEIWHKNCIRKENG